MISDPPFWLATSTDEGPVGALTPLVFGAPSVHGSHFCTLAADGRTINFTKDCTVIISIEGNVVADKSADGRVVWTLAGTVTQVSAYLAASGDGYSAQLRPGQGSTIVAPVWTTPPVKVAAGTTLQINEGVNLAAGTVAHDDTALALVRVD